MQFHVLQVGPSFSCPAISCPANWSVNFTSVIFTSSIFIAPKMVNNDWQALGVGLLDTWEITRIVPTNAVRIDLPTWLRSEPYLWGCSDKKIDWLTCKMAVEALYVRGPVCACVFDTAKKLKRTTGSQRKKTLKKFVRTSLLRSVSQTVSIYYHDSLVWSTNDH